MIEEVYRVCVVMWVRAAPSVIGMVAGSVNREANLLQPSTRKPGDFAGAARDANA